MPVFMIERNLPGAASLTHEELAEITAQSNKVVSGLGVPYRWITSYVAGDKIYCVHETERPETILEHAEKGGFPADLVTVVSEQIGDDYT